MRTAFSQLTLLLLTNASFAVPDVGATHQTVSAPTRLDWIFPFANQSPAKPPDGVLEDGYDSTKQSYDLFIPERANLKKPMPAVLFISAAETPQDGRAYEAICRQQGFIFISVRNAGNTVKETKRTRIVLDCFDDVRRQVPLDPDRTYIAGLSGGGRMACAIGFALPEYFGGIMPMAAGGELRNEAWLVHRAIDRLSVALITGQNDYNRGEVEKFRGPRWKEMGIRTKWWVQPGVGHNLANQAAFAEALKFLEAGREQRAALAKKYPSTRAAPSAVLDREAMAKAVFVDALAKLKAKESMFAGLMLLKGINERWPDLDTAKQALKLLKEFDAKTERPWEEDDIAEQRKFLIAEARAEADYAVAIPAKSIYDKQRPIIAQNAINRWKRVMQVSPDSPVAEEGKKRIAEMEKLLEKK
jgi:predicted esterase